MEAGISVMSQAMTYSHIVPPLVQEYVTVGHCSPVCTGQVIPGDGAKIFNVLLHSHLAGRKLKLRHFRNDEELPWISADEYFDFDYQLNRPLREPVSILGGDHLSIGQSHLQILVKSRKPTPPNH
jgi:hypothetical protein